MQNSSCGRVVVGVSRPISLKGEWPNPATSTFPGEGFFKIYSNFFFLSFCFFGSHLISGYVTSIFQCFFNFHVRLLNLNFVKAEDLFSIFCFKSLMLFLLILIFNFFNFPFIFLSIFFLGILWQFYFSFFFFFGY